MLNGWILPFGGVGNFTHLVISLSWRDWTGFVFSLWNFVLPPLLHDIILTKIFSFKEKLIFPSSHRITVLKGHNFKLNLLYFAQYFIQLLWSSCQRDINFPYYWKCQNKCLMISSNFTSNSQIELKLWPHVITTKMIIWTKITDVTDSNLLFKLFKTAETKQRRCLRAAAGCGTRFTFRRKIRCKFARRRKWSGLTKATPTPTAILGPPKFVELWKHFLLRKPSCGKAALVWEYLRCCLFMVFS